MRLGLVLAGVHVFCPFLSEALGKSYKKRCFYIKIIGLKD
jgi:hypothetical protein